MPSYRRNNSLSRILFFDNGMALLYYDIAVFIYRECVCICQPVCSAGFIFSRFFPQRDKEPTTRNKGIENTIRCFTNYLLIKLQFVGLLSAYGVAGGNGTTIPRSRSPRSGWGWRFSCWSVGHRCPFPRKSFCQFSIFLIGWRAFLF